MPRGIYRQLNLILKPSDHILKSSKYCLMGQLSKIVSTCRQFEGWKTNGWINVGYRLDIGRDVGDLNTTLYQRRNSEVIPTSNLDVELTL